MGENETFKEALGAFFRDSAYGEQVRHLHDLGFDAETIKKKLDYPATLEAVNAVISKYEEEKKSGTLKMTFFRKKRLFSIVKDCNTTQKPVSGYGNGPNFSE